ncbi:MAG TPA: carbonic anhydrase family protein [Thermoanaerobaculia bacterium]|nr:carbonic anhydrase family protein [Thermoanaerobaculia bacterium]
MTAKAPLLRLTLLSFLLAATSAASSGLSEKACQGEECCICEHGGSQSPIDIGGVTRAHLPRLEFHYRRAALVELVADGAKETIKATFLAPRPVLTIGGETFFLDELHFHSPGEHKIRGAGAAMELHLVHRNQAGEVAVVGALMTPAPNRPNPVFARILANAGPVPRQLRIQTEALLPADRHYFRYAGSLTTGNCAEGVRWHVLRSPLVVSPEQVAAYPFPDTARAVQPLNGRPVLGSH